MLLLEEKYSTTELHRVQVVFGCHTLGLRSGQTEKCGLVQMVSQRQICLLCQITPQFLCDSGSEKILGLQRNIYLFLYVPGVVFFLSL